ncbi:ABC transporter substrate-binding protein [Oricola sp.]|uniref:ABC transporter substrate-binding protein n=1 Tax=Oricola sp. TaxID=1979950 RepID=UPI0025CF42A4|nr:ABC transporter substrate-binding protein [Oricola sp.]MCI5076878.1 ABC transporter substrate-binding protein [Oricola sp.]
MKFKRRTFLGAVGAATAIGLAPRTSFAQVPKSGGDLVVAINGASTGDSLDPRTFNSPFMAVLGGTIYSTLVETTGPRAELQPGLALDWEEAQDGLVWTFNLAPNAKFHNGKPVTSADVIYSLMYHVAEGSRSTSRAIIKAVDKVEADGDHRIVVTLKAPNFYFPASLSNFSLGIVPEGTTEFTGIGSGPYRVTNFVPGEILETERFDDYFKTGKAHVNTVTILAANDPSARISAIQSGQAHIVGNLDARAVPLLQALPTVNLQFQSGTGFGGFNMMLDRAPFDNALLRQAMKHAIDREDFIQRIYGGHARLGNDTPVPPDAVEYAADVVQIAYDPDRARDLFKQSGHSGPIVLQTSSATGAAAVDAATLFKEHASRAGIEIEVKREPADGYWGNIWAQSPFHATVWGARPTVDLIMTLAYSSSSPVNDTAFKDPDFDAALQVARGAPDAEERLQASHLAQRILNENGGAIIPAFQNTPEGVSTQLAGYVTGTQAVGSFRAAENVWFV